MNKITKNILWTILLSSPVCVSFAANSAYMDKINQVTQGLKSSLHSTYDLPAISQYLSGGGGSTPSKPSTASTPSIPSGGTIPSSSTPEVPTSNTTPSSGGSWYVQPGDTGASGSSSSGSSSGGFDHSNLY